MRRLLLLIAFSAALLAADFPHGYAMAAQQPTPRPGDTPGEAERRTLIDRLFANQHADDFALTIFQRFEHQQVRERGSDTTPSEDKTFRVVPNGTGFWRVLVEDHGRPLPATDVRAQMTNLEHFLVLINDPANSDMRRARDKFNARMKSRSDLISAVHDAYVWTWIGREMRNGRTVAKFHLEPNPNYKPVSRETEIFLHSTATVWVDEAAAQAVRVEAELTSDFSVGAGVLGKVYRGSRMSLEQSEVAPGVWLPLFYQYDFTGRKFLFGFESHERNEASHYERIGPPSEALAFIRRELTASAPSTPPRAQQ
jgi:hypothetical protein